jgi:hypothetical protein
MQRSEATKAAWIAVALSSSVYFVLATVVLGMGLVVDDISLLPSSNAPASEHAFFLTLVAAPVFSVWALFFAWRACLTGESRKAIVAAVLPWLYLAGVAAVAYWRIKM